MIFFHKKCITIYFYRFSFPIGEIISCPVPMILMEAMKSKLPSFDITMEIENEVMDGMHHHLAKCFKGNDL